MIAVSTIIGFEKIEEFEGCWFDIYIYAQLLWCDRAISYNGWKRDYHRIEEQWSECKQYE